MTVESKNRRGSLFWLQSVTKEYVVNLWSQSTIQQNNPHSCKHGADMVLRNTGHEGVCVMGWARIISQR